MPHRKLLRASTHLLGTHRHVTLDGGDAFVPDYRHGFWAWRDGDAEALGEEFIAAATSADAVAEAARDELVADELGGISIEVVPAAGEGTDRVGRMTS